MTIFYLVYDVSLKITIKIIKSSKFITEYYYAKGQARLPTSPLSRSYARPGHGIGIILPIHHGAKHKDILTCRCIYKP